MRKLFVTALSFLLLSGYLQAQTSSLKGSVSDTTDKKNLENTVVSLLREKDSALVKFTRVDKTGKKGVRLKIGKYL